jgi:hypothetical protein
LPMNVVVASHARRALRDDSMHNLRFAAACVNLIYKTIFKKPREAIKNSI